MTSCTNLNFTATNITFDLTAECSDTSSHFVPTAYDLSNHPPPSACPLPELSYVSRK